MRMVAIQRSDRNGAPGRPVVFLEPEGSGSFGHHLEVPPFRFSQFPVPEVDDSRCHRFRAHNAQVWTALNCQLPANRQNTLMWQNPQDCQVKKSRPPDLRSWTKLLGEELPPALRAAIR